MSHADATFVGRVDSVKGSIVTVRVTDNTPTLIMVSGQSYRVGQIGSFLRIPLGFTQLYGVCTLVGSAAAPNIEMGSQHISQKWLSITLFGESCGDIFERGVSQYPTFGDEVHLVTVDDIKTIYNTSKIDNTITLGNIAASSGIPGRLNLDKFVSRHSAIVGSTGSGKSNLVAVILEAIATQGFSSSRVLIVDPHGEYGSSVREKGYVFKVNPEKSSSYNSLYVPYWALPFDELRKIAFGEMQPNQESIVREIITEKKREASKYLKVIPAESTITADSPIPFNIKQLWFELDDYERQTFKEGKKDPMDVIVKGDPEKLISNEYPQPSPGSKEPYVHPNPRRIYKQLDLLRGRIQDSNYGFLFEPSSEFTPDKSGKCKCDLDVLIKSWIGHERPITVLDVSGLPSDILSTIVGTLLRIIYDMLFWGTKLPVGGREQPLLIMLEEAHLFLPEGEDSPAHRTVAKIAKEGRKYGVGLSIITQRPTEVDQTTLSQCGTFIALRMTNSKDRSKVESALPDDLGSLSGMLPSLRTGEGLVIGEAMPIPSRIQFYRAGSKPIGDDPQVAAAWQKSRPDGKYYSLALGNWRNQSISEEEK